MARSWPIFLIVSALATLLLFYVTSTHLGKDIKWTAPRLNPLRQHAVDRSDAYDAQLKSRLASGSMKDILNRTLGFQEIQLISLPSRDDKRDAFAVAASVSGLDFGITDGVNGEDISPKALPYKMDQKPKVLGCWRAHLDVWKDMIRRKVTSTLVFEDDADWDVSIRAQMVELARGARYTLDEAKTNPHSPYGDDWDLLWIGHCGSSPTPWNTRRYVIHNDSTVEPPDGRAGVGRPDMSRWEGGPKGDNSTRVIYPAIGGVCTASYAISLKGAQKALYRTSMVPYNAPIDWGLNDICSDRDFGFKCVSTYPSVIGLYRPAGNTSRNSDIGYGKESDAGIDEEGHPERLVFSTRTNMERLLTGKTSFLSVYPEVTGEEMELADIARASGIEVEVPPNPTYAHLTNDEYRQLHWDWDNVNLE